MNLQIDPRISQNIQINRDLPQPEKAKDLKKLRESARELEAMYMFEVFKSMRKSVPEDGLIKTPSSTKMFQEMLDMEIARKSAEGPGMGIGKAIYNQLKKNIK